MVSAVFHSPPQASQEARAAAATAARPAKPGPAETRTAQVAQQAPAEPAKQPFDWPCRNQVRDFLYTRHGNIQLQVA